MAQEQQEQDERTEEATQLRRDQAREKGQLPRSRDLVAALTLLAGVTVLCYRGEGLALAIGHLARACFALPATGVGTDGPGLLGVLGPGLHGVALAVAPLL